MKKLLFLIFFLVLFGLFSCTEPPAEDTYYNVMVFPTEGMTVNSENPIRVKKGDTAVFDITVEDTYLVEAVSAGKYNRDTGKLTVSGVRADMAIDFVLVNVGYDATETFDFYFRGTGKDYANVGEVKLGIKAGTVVTVKAVDTTRRFVGWSFGKTLAQGGSIVSDSREYSFAVNSSLSEGGRILIFPNYSSAVMYAYDLNGGEADLTSENSKENPYYTVALNDGRLEVILNEIYFSKMDTASLFYDDGTFVRDGYILKEYNTKPDGTGVGYSLGSKFFFENEGDAVATLYCIWSEASPASDFIYEDYTYALPTGSSVEKAPHFKENGIILKSYTGNSPTVTVPDMIDGKYVIAIDTGCFSNKDMEALVMGRFLIEVKDGAFVGCDKLETIYYPDGLYDIGNAAFDRTSYTSLKNLYVNATLAPRYSKRGEGAFAFKLSKLLASEAENRIIVVAGSSTYQGLATEYLEALIKDYTVINFGTTRTTNGVFYLEAMAAFVHSGDVVIASPENSIYMMGENELYFKTCRDLEGMLNLYRYVDISNYTNVFGALSDLNKSYRYKESPTKYEDIVTVNYVTTDGDYQHADRLVYCNDNKYTASYFITMNERVKSKFDVDWGNVTEQEANKDYSNPNNITWCSFTDSEYSDAMNRAFDLIKAGGARVYFSFAPTDEAALVEGAGSYTWLSAYDELIINTYTSLDGVLGRSADYVMNHQYFYNCAFHPNDFGRAWRTYQLYLDLHTALGIEGTPLGYLELGTDFVGCRFENSDNSTPIYKTDFSE